jgi:hypothetical protein
MADLKDSRAQSRLEKLLGKEGTSGRIMRWKLKLLVKRPLG